MRVHVQRTHGEALHVQSPCAENRSSIATGHESGDQGLLHLLLLVRDCCEVPDQVPAQEGMDLHVRAHAVVMRMHPTQLVEPALVQTAAVVMRMQ